MARSTITPSNTSSAHHLALPFPLFIVCVAAIVAVVGALCGSRHIWRHSSGAKSEKIEKNMNLAGKATVAPSKLTTSAMVPMEAHKDGTLVQEGDAQQRLKEIKVVSQSHKIEVPENLLYPLPLPAGRMSGRIVLPASPVSKPTSNHRRISKSLSMKLPSFSRIRSMKEPEKSARDECIWKKAIILGEKCRVPGEEGEDAILYDEKGNRIVAYAPRTPRSLPASRTPSFIDTRALPRQHS